MPSRRRIDAGEGVGPVGVADHEPALVGVTRDVEGGTAQAVDAVGRDEERQLLSERRHQITLIERVELLEAQVVDEVHATDPRNLDPQPERLRVGLLGAYAEHHLEGSGGDLHENVGRGGVPGGGVDAHRCSHGPAARPRRSRQRRVLPGAGDSWQGRPVGRSGQLQPPLLCLRRELQPAFLRRRELLVDLRQANPRRRSGRVVVGR